MTTFIQAYHRSPGGNTAPFRQVIHATCPPQPKDADWFWSSGHGMAVGTAHYFQNPDSGGSAHFVGDIGELVQCLPEDAVAWHAPPNPHTLGYEICGQSWYSREQWLAPEVWPAVERVAVQVLADARRFNIPIRRLSVAEVHDLQHGQCGHVDVSEAFHQSDHTDPGPGFPWDKFMALLEGPVKAPSGPVGATNPPSGAPVTPGNNPPLQTATDEDVMATLDEVRTMLQEELKKVTDLLHGDHKVIIHGDASHGNSLDSIAEHVGVGS